MLQCILISQLILYSHHFRKDMRKNVNFIFFSTNTLLYNFTILYRFISSPEATHFIWIRSTIYLNSYHIITQWQRNPTLKIIFTMFFFSFFSFSPLLHIIFSSTTFIFLFVRWKNIFLFHFIICFIFYMYNCDFDGMMISFALYHWRIWDYEVYSEKG